MRGSQEDRERLSIDRPWQGDNQFLEKVFKVEAFRKLYRQRLTEFCQTLFKPERFERQVNELAAVIDKAVKDESEERYERFQTAVAGKENIGGGFMTGGAKPIKGFVPARSKSIEEQLAGKSTGNMVGGGFGPGGPGGRGGDRGPGMFMAGTFMSALDTNKDEKLTKDEVKAQLGKLYDKWNAGKSGPIGEEDLRSGIDKDFALRFPGGFGG
jgi:hypothetical protein